MPSIATHHYFGQDVLNNLDKKIVKHFKDETLIYSTFAQSHDYLYYFLSPNIKKSKHVKNIGSRGHHENTQDYLINIVKYIKDNKLEKKQELIAYLYGSVTHYCLDSTCHPFIFYKTGVYRKGPEYKKYHGLHELMEKDLDAIYYELNTHKKYNTCNLNRDIIKKPIFSETLITALNSIYEKTYNEKNVGKYYQQGLKCCKLINFFIVNDYFGIKRCILYFFDFITNHHFGYTSSYSTHILNPNLDYLNLSKKEWNHPSGRHVKYNSSFPELYEIAFNKSIKIIKELHEVIFNNKDIKTLYKVIPNIDYSTGMKIEENLRMDYFEE